MYISECRILVCGFARIFVAHLAITQVTDHRFSMGSTLNEAPKEVENSTEGLKDPGKGSRVNGKDWKGQKDPFRIKRLGVTKPSNFKEREAKKLQEQQYRARLQELKQEKEDAKNQRIADLKRRREIKEEKERYEKLAAKMHAKKVERLRKKEKRNKLLKER